MASVQMTMKKKQLKMKQFDADYFLPSDDSEDGKDGQDRQDGEDDDDADSLELDLEQLNIKTISDDLAQDLNHLNISDFGNFGDFGDCELNESDILACKFQFSVFFHILHFKIIYLLTCCGLFY